MTIQQRRSACNIGIPRRFRVLELRAVARRQDKAEQLKADQSRSEHEQRMERRRILPLPVLSGRVLAFPSLSLRRLRLGSGIDCSRLDRQTDRQQESVAINGKTRVQANLKGLSCVFVRLPAGQCESTLILLRLTGSTRSSNQSRELLICVAGFAVEWPVAREPVFGLLLVELRVLRLRRLGRKWPLEHDLISITWEVPLFHHYWEGP